MEQWQRTAGSGRRRRGDNSSAQQRRDGTAFSPSLGALRPRSIILRWPPHLVPSCNSVPSGKPRRPVGGLGEAKNRRDVTCGDGMSSRSNRELRRRGGPSTLDSIGQPERPRSLSGFPLPCPTSTGGGGLRAVPQDASGFTRLLRPSYGETRVRRPQGHELVASWRVCRGLALSWTRGVGLSGCCVLRAVCCSAV